MSRHASLFRRNGRSQFISFVVLLLMLAGAMGRPAKAAPSLLPVLPWLRAVATAQPDQTFRVIISRVGNNRDDLLEQQVLAAGGELLGDLSSNALVAEVPGRAIEGLGLLDLVKFIAPDAPMVVSCAECGPVSASKLATLFPRVVNATGLWSATASTPAVTGAGVGIAILDTGVNADREDWIGPSGTSRIVASERFSASEETVRDGYGHGTHVASIAAGNSWRRSESFLKGKYVGVAPGANIIDVKVSDDAGVSYISDVVRAIDWVVENRETYNIRVMNLSMVSSVPESYLTSLLAAAVERAWFNGIFVVVAAGNGGPATMYYPPANDPFVVTVGASDPMGTATRKDDGMAPWSSHGLTQNLHSKPDVVAPGRYIAAAMASNTSYLAQQMPERIVDRDYLWMSGTSMAAPVVAGVAALVFQAHPEWSNDQVKWLLARTATKLKGPALLGLVPLPLPGQGAGEVDALAAVRYRSTPSRANQLQLISLHLTGPKGEMAYSSSSWSSSSWSSSSWSSSSWSSSSWSSSSWSSSSWSSSSWSSSSWSSLADLE